MGDQNQYIFVKKYQSQLNGPFLEVGSKDYGSTPDFRSLLNPKERFPYIGIDMSEGKGVDMVIDLTQEFEIIDKKLGSQRFGTILCMSVLEHCSAPFNMAECLTRLLIPNGKLVVGVPFAWEFHGYPNDYWRFSHEGVKKLFPKLNFDEFEAHAASGLKEGKSTVLGPDMAKIPFGFQSNNDHSKTAISNLFFRILYKVGFVKALEKYGFAIAPAPGYGFLLEPTMINMIGVMAKS